jgi:hypothetical protein
LRSEKDRLIIGMATGSIQSGAPGYWRDAAAAWIDANQLGRRNLTLTSWCMLAEELAEALAPKAKKNPIDGGQIGGESKAKGSSILTEPLDAREMAAREACVSAGSMSAYKFIKENAPEKIAELRSDPNANLHRVVKDVRESKQRDARQSKRTEAAKESPELNDQIIVGDFREHADKIADGSVSLIFTDPPYDREASKI